MTLTKVGESNKKAFEPLLFGLDPTQKNRIALGVLISKMPVGIGVFDLDGSVVTITHLYVLEKYRRKGVGTEIINGFLQDAAAYSYFAASADYISDPATNRFFEKQDFSVIEEDPLFAIPLKGLVSGTVMKFLSLGKEKRTVLSVAELSGMQMRGLNTELVQNDLDPEALFMGINKELSLVLFDKEGRKPLSLVVVDDVDRDVCIRYICNFTNNPANIRMILYRLGKIIKKTCDTETGNLLFVIVDPAMEKLVAYICQEVSPTSDNHMANAYKMLMNEEGEFDNV